MEYEAETILNTSRQDIHLHLQIIALKCFLYLFYVENFLVDRSRELKFYPFLMPYFIKLSKYMMSRIMSFFAFGMGLAFIHNELQPEMLYVYFLACCCVFPSFQLVLDIYLIGWYFRRIVATNTPSDSVLTIIISVIAWMWFPPLLLFFVVFSFCITFIFIKRGVERLKLSYCVTALTLWGCLYAYPRMKK